MADVWFSHFLMLLSCFSSPTPTPLSSSSSSSSVVTCTSFHPYTTYVTDILVLGTNYLSV